MTQPELQALCFLWRERLHQEHWDINCAFVPAHTIDYGNARTTKFIDDFRAKIRFAIDRPISEFNDKRWTYDYLAAHEICHLALPYPGSDNPKWEEQAAHTFSAALVIAYGGTLYEDVE